LAGRHGRAEALLWTPEVLLNQLQSLSAPQREQGSLESLIAPVAFLNERCFITRDGQIGCVVAVNGVDVECSDDSVIEDYRDSLQSAIGVFDHQFRVYQYLSKRRHTGLVTPPCSGTEQAREAIEDRLEFLNSRPLYAFALHFVIVIDPSGEKIAGERPNPFYFSSEKITRAQVVKSKSLVTELETACQSFVRQMESVCPMGLLQKTEAFRFLSRLINLDPLTADYYTHQSDFGLDVGLAQSEVELHADGMSQHGFHMALLTLRKEPSDSANAARAFQGLPCEFVLCLEWKRVDDTVALAHTRSLRESRANNLTPSSLFSAVVNYFKAVNPTPTPKDQVIDPSAMESVNRLGKVLVSLGNDGRFYGRASLRLCLFSKDPAELRGAIAKAREAFGPKEGKLFLERMGAFNTWLSMIPGNQRAAVPSQYLWMENTTYADFGQIFTADPGNPVNEHLPEAPALTVATTELGTPYHFNLHVGGVGHAIALGATRSGKSFLVNHLLDCLQQYPDTQTQVWDIGGSYRQLTEIHHGSYIEMRADRQQYTINPFSLPQTNDNLQFLSRFAQSLFGTYKLSEEARTALYDSVVKVYDLAANRRNLSAYVKVLPLELGRQLRRWVGEGQYAAWFDHAHDNVTFARFQTYDFARMKEFPDVVQPLMMYLMRRFRQLETDPGLSHALKVFAIDEAWQFLLAEESKGEIRDAVKTGGKNNLMVLLATQSIEDLEQSGIVAQLEDNCPTQIFVAVKKSTVCGFRGM